jgi:hypothetical protein
MAIAAIPYSLEFSIENSIGWGRGESQDLSPACQPAILAKRGLICCFALQFSDELNQF